MTQLKFNYRIFLKPNGRVFMRVRWNGGKNESSIGLPLMADRTKWNSDSQRAIRNTIHEVNGETYSARSINNGIESAIEKVEILFQKFQLGGKLPTVAEVKEYLNEQFIQQRPESVETNAEINEPSLSALFDSFILNYGQENNWAPKTRYKYDQAYNLMKAYHQSLKLSAIDKKFLNGFKVWLIEQGYKNSTVTKYFRCLRTLFRWIKEEGYPVSDDILGYRSKLAVPVKTVIYLKYEEVLRFENYVFPETKQYLARARDLFCFMCYTSLRYSDLKSLKKAAVADNVITMHSQKTKGKLKIPLVRHAARIYERYAATTPGEYVFPVPSSQKLNSFLKEAAKMVGLDREVIDTTYCGNDRIEEVMKLHEAISCHDARRTFVCISLSLGIPQSVVMSCTGHADYATMKPYIAISDETSKHELVKWEIGSVRNELNSLLDGMNEDALTDILNYVKNLRK